MRYNRHMAEYVKAIKKSVLSSGAKKSVFVSGKHLMIANVAGEFFAIDDTCSHAGCSLGAEGMLKGNTVTCGCHGSQFDVGSGRVLNPPASANQASYKVKVEGDDVLVLV